MSLFVCVVSNLAAKKLISFLTSNVMEPYATNALKHEESTNKNISSCGETGNPRKVFVGNICYEVRSGELKSFFSKFGDVKFVQLLWDKGRRRFKGSAFVTFCSVEGAQAAKLSPEGARILNDRVMTVAAAESRRSKKRSQEKSDRTDQVTDDIPIPDSPEELKLTSLSLADGTQMTNKEAIDEEQSVAGSLPDDILISIFSFLQVADRIRVERVCKRWRHAALLSWQSVKNLHFENVFRGVFAKGGTHTLTHSILKSVLQRGCQGLLSLDVSASPRGLNHHSAELIGRQCPNLTHINLSGMKINNHTLQELSRQCTKLKKVELRRCLDIGEKGFWWLLKHCSHIEHFDCSENVRITGQCLHLLNPNCHTVLVNQCSNLSDKGIERLTEKCPGVKILGISKCFQLTGASISRISQACSSLEKLYLAGDYPSVSSESLCHLGSLSSLQYLQMKDNLNVSDEVLSRLSKGCQNLKFLDISGCFKEVSSEGILHLAGCSALEDLNISYIDKAADDGLAALAMKSTLKRLVARGCPEISDLGLVSLANHCLTLAELDVSGCEEVTEAGAKEFVRIRGEMDPDIRAMYPTLNLTLGGTAVTESFSTTLSTGVHVSHLDLSVPQKRLQLESFGQFFPSDEEEDWETEMEPPDHPASPRDHSHHLEELGVDSMEEWNNQRQMHYGTVDFSMSEEYAEDFLDADDPSMWEDEFFAS